MTDEIEGLARQLAQFVKSIPLAPPYTVHSVNARRLLTLLDERQAPQRTQTLATIHEDDGEFIGVVFPDDVDRGRRSVNDSLPNAIGNLIHDFGLRIYIRNGEWTLQPRGIEPTWPDWVLNKDEPATPREQHELDRPATNREMLHVALVASNKINDIEDTLDDLARAARYTLGLRTWARKWLGRRDV